MEPRVLIQAEGLTKEYRTPSSLLPVLRGVDLRIEKGSFTVIAGPSGAGKSTLLHILGGLDEPTGGTVFFAGKDLYGCGERELSRIRNERMGFVFQFYHLLPEFTVMENVLMPAWIRSGVSVRGRHEQARELLDSVGLLERAGHFPGQLSGGERQRAAFVRALINGPEALFCDEPTGNLDSETGAAVMDLIRSWCRQRGLSAVVVTHNLELARGAGQVLYLRDGRLQAHA